MFWGFRLFESYSVGYVKKLQSDLGNEIKDDEKFFGVVMDTYRDRHCLATDELKTLITPTIMTDA